MAYIKVHHKNIKTVNGRKQNTYETDTNLDLDVFTLRSGRGYQIFDDNKLIADVESGQIEINGKRLSPIKYSAGWILSETPEVLLEIGDGNSFLINGQKVCSINYGNAIINWLIGIIKERRYRPYAPFTEISFDENKLDPLVALCLIFEDIRFRSSGD